VSIHVTIAGRKETPGFPSASTLVIKAGASDRLTTDIILIYPNLSSSSQQGNHLLVRAFLDQLKT
jgi:hypothetical protein